MEFANVVTIARPPQEVFEFLARFDNIPSWNPAIEKTRPVTDDPVGVGKRYRQTRSTPFRAEELFEVTAFHPYRTLRVEGDFGPLHGTLTYELRDLCTATLLTNTAHLKARALVRIVAAVASHRIQTSVAANLETLKKLLEGGSALMTTVGGAWASTSATPLHPHIPGANAHVTDRAECQVPK